VILGTAGHIDHGKTTLVRALTGVNTDRLPEEKRRGITIELGFAPLELEGVGTLGVVDVPGHEAFVRTMVAGATGVDLALLVVAADEGVMPQTREHLAILRLLGVDRGVVALTKADLVDAEWLALVEEDVRDATALVLPNAAIVATSAATGDGIDALRAAIAAVAQSVARRDERDLFRLAVDRAFSIKGTGTVVTGTVWSGSLAHDASVRILPSDHAARVRAIQGHGAQLDNATSGVRAAIALAGTDVADVPRSSTIVTDRDWHATTLARADITVIGDVELRPRAWLRFHVGTAEVGARVVGRRPDGAERFPARLVFDAPVVLRAGDRFVLRTTAPLNTVAGGVITDPYAPRRARPWPLDAGVSDRLARMVVESGGAGLPIATLPVRLGLAPAECDALVAAPSAAWMRTGDRLVDARLLAEMEAALSRVVDEFHVSNPLEPGVSIQFLRSQLGASPLVADAAIARAERGGKITLTGGVASRAGFSPTLSANDSALADTLLQRLDRAGAEPPGAEELQVELGAPVDAVLRYLERRGDIVQIEAGRYYVPSHLMLLIDRLRVAFGNGGERSPSELREALGLSRKYLIPFLEYCDRIGHTMRGTNGRVWRGT
jgi:selenocysteine-specific elongation factor